MSYQRYRPTDMPPVVKNLIIINVIVFIAQMVLDKQYDVTNKIGLWPYGAEPFKPYQIVTSMFAHSPALIFHIVFNMFVLYSFGRVLEMVWKEKRFLFFYLASGIGAALVHLLVIYLKYGDMSQYGFEFLGDGTVQSSYAEFVNNQDKFEATVKALAPAVGASGAIMGIMAAFAYLFPNTELYIMFIPMPVKAKWAILGYVVIDLFGGFYQIPGDNIAHFAHLGGALTGFLLVLYWNKTNRKTLY
jgi:membrane associated rhomboid family serine protease